MENLQNQVKPRIQWSILPQNVLSQKYEEFNKSDKGLITKFISKRLVCCEATVRNKMKGKYKMSMAERTAASMFITHLENGIELEIEETQNL